MVGFLSLFLSWYRIQSIKFPIDDKQFKQNCIDALTLKKNTLNDKKSIINRAIYNDSINNLFSIFNANVCSELDNLNLAVQIYNSDTLVFWTNNKIAGFKNNIKSNQVIRLQNGWYYFYKEKTKDYDIVYSIKIKDQFTVQNQFLKDNFLLFNLKNTNVLITNQNILKSNNRSKDLIIDGKYLFSYQLISNELGHSKDLFSFILILISFISFLHFIRLFTFKIITSKVYALLVFVFIVIVFRAILLQFNTDSFWNELSLFDPSTFAISTYNPSLGDYLINTIIFYYFINTIFSQFSLIVYNKLNQRIQIIISIICLISLSFLFTHYVSVLVIDSNVNYNFNNFIELNTNTFIAISIIAILSNSYYLLAIFFLKRIVSQVAMSELIFLFSSLLFVWLVLIFTQYNLGASNFFFIAVILIFCYLFDRAQIINNSYSKVVAFISVFAIWSSIIINNQLISKKEQTAKILAEKLSLEKDIVAENLFNEVSKKIQGDSILINDLYRKEKQKQTFFKRLIEKYFNGYWEKFETKMYVYDLQCNQIAKSTNANDEKLTVFEEVCGRKELLSSAQNLFYVPTENDEDAGLLCKFIFNKDSDKKEPLTLYIQFTIKYNADEIGFPSLLLDNKIGQAKEKFNDFSYAKYRYNLLIPISKNNLYNYSLNSNFIKEPEIDKQLILNNGYFNYQDFRHYFYKPYKSSTYLVSFKYLTFFEKITSSSYLFVIFILLFSLKYFVENWNEMSWPNLDTLNKKIRLVLISSVVLGLLILAVIATYFFVSHFNYDKNNNLTDNIRSLLIELENKFGDEKLLQNSNTEYYNYLLSKSSNVFFNDINLYDLKGNLIASSRFKIFDEGILGTKINNIAFNELTFNKEARFLNKESIGNLNYVSVYIPFLNNSNNLIGYIHIPFFDKENILKKEMFNLLATVINIYFILFVFIAVLAWWMTNKITYPLTVLKDRFANIDLNKNNAIIEWNTNDEIGGVVKEYNKMVIQLNDSANRLAQNQRELAWREMAKQVAHEIKNPLTPMKLNVQFLQQNMQLNGDLFKEKYSKVAISLIEQIDSLANIASDFSSFAQIAKNNPERINLMEITGTVIELFKSHINVEIEFTPSQNPCFIYADKDHILRVLNNLINNAIQAENKNKLKRIKIEILNVDDTIKLEISDNGSGISEEMKDKIFKPYFTTKNSGSGLGLAMVRQIIEGMEGKVYFDNLLSGGVKFTIELKKIN